MSSQSRRRFRRVFIVTSLMAATLGILFVIAHAERKFRPSPSNLLYQSKDKERADRIRSEAVELSSAFDGWTKVYLAVADPGALVTRGVELARQRRALVKELILIDPARALALAVPPDTKRKMPLEIQAHLEEQISSYGDYSVIVSDEIDPLTGAFKKSHIDRTVVIKGKVYTASVYGRWLEMTSKKNIPISGIAIDDVMAVNESPVRNLSREELVALSSIRRVEEGEVAVELGGEIRYFPNEQSLAAFTQALIAREMMIGPDTEAHKDRLVRDGITADSAWTEGPKKVLLIRVDFSDKPGEPVDANNQVLTVSRAQQVISNEVNPFYIASSYNKTSQQVTVTTLVRLPQTLAFYEQANNYSMMLTDARNGARSAGFETNNFDLDIVAFSYSTNFSWAGRGALGGKGAWLNGYFDLRVTAHELGHNYGLHHANRWGTTDGTVIGQGNDIEYGDWFDAMGIFGGPEYHFNARYKRTLEWLLENNVQTITQDGVYRVFAQDSPTAGGVRVLRIRKNAEKDYWIEFRQLFTDNPNAMNGAIVRWDYQSEGSRRTQLLDMNSGTGDISDAPLSIGHSFSDNENRIKITVVGKGNTTPESLDVRVEVNVGCTFSLGQTSQNFSASGGEGSIPVNTLSGCRPLANSNDSWVSPIAGDGSPVRYIVAANYESQPRTGTITVAGQTFTVIQAAAATECVPRPSGLVAWWRGEGNALDQTGVNNGTPINDMSFGAGKIGGGFVSDGGLGQAAKRVFVPDSASLRLTQSLAIEGWIRLDAYNAGQSNVIIRSDDDNVFGTYDVQVGSTGVITFRIQSAPNGNTASVSSPSGISLGQFVHFAGTLDDSTGQMKLYLNGSLVRKINTTLRPYGDLNPDRNPGIGIGNSPSKSFANYSFNGVIDELSVYNRALSAFQVQAIYSSGSAGTGATGKCISDVECSFSLVQTNQNFPASGGEGNIAVNTQGGCAAPATTADSWLLVIPSDTSAVRYLGSANYESQPRTGTIIVAGQTFTVNQAAATTECVPRPSGLVAWWRGEGNATDQTGVNNGALVNMAFGGGRVGGGFLGDFKGNAGMVQMPDSPSLALNNSMTFEGWLKISSFGGTVIERRTSSLGSYQVWMPSFGELAFTVWYNSDSGIGVSSNPLPLGEFVHFAASLDDATGQMKMYINGSLVRQFTTTRRPNPLTNAQINVGNINGITDELGVYNRALSASEIQAIYTAGVATTGATGKCLPSSIPINVQTNPAGRAFTVDGTVYTSAQTFAWVPGSSHTISTTSPQAGSPGTQYVWNNWTDSGAIVHAVTPTVATTYTANFTTQFMLTMTAGAGGTVSPASGFFNSGQSVNISATPNSGFTFSNWTGSGTGSFSGATNPASVTMNGPITETAGFAAIPLTIQFSASTYNLNEGAGFLNASVTRSGDASSAASVIYATSSGNAKEGKDYVSAQGILNFAAGEISKSFPVLVIDNAFVDGARTVNLALSNPSGATLGQSTAVLTIIDNDLVAGLNPLDTPRSFVQYDYYDFLGRYPDASGWDFWTNQITNCGLNAQCIEVQRINVSASFFLSIEFQQTGYMVERFYKVAFGNANGNSTFGGAHTLQVPILRFDEFLRDSQRVGRGVVVLAPGWEQLLESNKQAYAQEFVQTARFITAFPTSMTPAQFVDRLNQNAGNVLSSSERTTAINLFGGAGTTTNATARAQAVRQVAEDIDLYNAEYNRAFVLAEYYGYLRRNPNDAPDPDYTGYDFWLTKLNQFNGNYINAEMVKAFLSSIEYRQRFGP